MFWNICRLNYQCQWLQLNQDGTDEGPHHSQDSQLGDLGEMESEDTLGPRVGFYNNIWNGETGVECLMWPGLVNMMYNNVTSNGPSEIKIFPKFMINFWHFWDNLWNLAKYKFLQYLPCFSPPNFNKRQQNLESKYQDLYCENLYLLPRGVEGGPGRGVGLRHKDRFPLTLSSSSDVIFWEN